MMIFDARQKQGISLTKCHFFSALPQTILTFSFACSELNDWQRHTLLGSYLFSYAPQVLGFVVYVLPSTSYKKEFYETFVEKKCQKWMMNMK